MKILMISKLYSPHIGGVERHVKEISKLFIRKGGEVEVITERFEKCLKKREQINGVKILRISYPKTKLLGLIFIWLSLFKYRNKFRVADIIHIHDVFIWYLPFRFLYPFKRVFITFHGWEGIYPVPKRNVFQKKLATLLCKKNICVGKYISKYYGVKPDSVIYGAVNKVNTEKLRKTSKSLVFVGRLEKDTGLPILLNSLRLLKSHKISFCGDGSLRTECEKYGHVYGFTSPFPILRSSEICFASGYLSVLEAFTCKCSVIAGFENPLRKDYFKLAPFSKWIVSVDNPVALTQNIEAMFSDPRRKKTIEEAYRWVQDQTWSKVVDKYLQLWGEE